MSKKEKLNKIGKLIGQKTANEILREIANKINEEKDIPHWKASYSNYDNVLAKVYVNLNSDDIKIIKNIAKKTAIKKLKSEKEYSTIEFDVGNFIDDIPDTEIEHKLDKHIQEFID